MKKNSHINFDYIKNELRQLTTKNGSRLVLLFEATSLTAFFLFEGFLLALSKFDNNLVSL